MLIDYLKSDLAARTRKNPGYSLRAYARALQIDSSTLSSIFRGKRPLSLKMARKIVDRLSADPALRQLLFASLTTEGAAEGAGFSLLAEDEIEAIAGWEHFALLSLLETKTCKRGVRGMASQLGITPGVALSALSRLEKLGLARRERLGWVSTGKQVTTSQDIPSAALRRAHMEYLGKAVHSLEHHSVSERDISGITMAISRRKLPQAKRLIEEFRRNLCRFLEEGEKDAVYRLNVQLFPLKK